jgi:hypothetical protein
MSLARALPLSLVSLLALACDPASVPDDASAPDASIAPDAFSVGVAEVHWEPVPLDDAMPALWGWSAAPLGDGRTVILGGAVGAFATETLGEALVIEPGAGSTLSVRTIARPSVAPSGRWCTCATFDAARGRVLFAGGRNEGASGGIAGSTWELDPTEGSFRELVDAPTPPGVIGCALAYSAQRRATYWFGGASASVVSGRTFRLDADGTSWIELDATGPTPRYDAHFEALDDRRLLLFGGSYGSRGAAFYADVWIFDSETETWTEIPVEGATPPGRRTPWVRLTPGGGGFYAGFGYDGAMLPLGDLHHFDLERAAWTEVTGLDPMPGARGFAPAVEGPAGSIGILLPGLGDGVVVRDAYVLRPND